MVKSVTARPASPRDLVADATSLRVVNIRPSLALPPTGCHSRHHEGRLFVAIRHRPFRAGPERRGGHLNGCQSADCATQAQRCGRLDRSPLASGADIRGRRSPGGRRPCWARSGQLVGTAVEHLDLPEFPDRTVPELNGARHQRVGRCRQRASGADAGGEVRLPSKARRSRIVVRTVPGSSPVQTVGEPDV